MMFKLATRLTHSLVLCTLSVALLGTGLSLAATEPTPPPTATLDDIIRLVEQKTLEEKRHQDERVASFVAEKQQQKKLFNTARSRFKAVEKRADELRTGYEANEKTIAAKTEELALKAGDLNDVFAIVRQVAISTNSTVENSMVSAELPNRSEFLLQIGKSEHTPRIDDMRQLWLSMLHEVNESGKVSRFQGTVIDRDGEESMTEVVRVGVFTAIKNGQYLRYLPSSNKLVELSRQPNYRFRQLASGLEGAESGNHPMALDPSKGAILSALVQTPDIKERTKQGGIIGYLILVIGVIGLIMIAQRWLRLVITKRRVKSQLTSGEPAKSGPLRRLKDSVGELQQTSADVLTMRLDEQMAEESALLYRGLGTVAVLAAVSPLLGLLGTVTGMIETFNSITLFGTGDPKLMSGGISQALITTQLGLSVAIPLVLLHSLVSGKANEVVELLSRYSSELFSDHVYQ